MANQNKTPNKSQGLILKVGLMNEVVKVDRRTQHGKRELRVYHNPTLATLRRIEHITANRPNIMLSSGGQLSIHYRMFD